MFVCCRTVGKHTALCELQEAALRDRYRRKNLRDIVPDEGGKLHNNLRLTRAQKQEELPTYQKTIVQSIREISNALIGCQKML